MNKVIFVILLLVLPCAFCQLFQKTVGELKTFIRRYQDILRDTQEGFETCGNDVNCIIDVVDKLPSKLKEQHSSFEEYLADVTSTLKLLLNLSI